MYLPLITVSTAFVTSPRAHRQADRYGIHTLFSRVRGVVGDIWPSFSSTSTRYMYSLMMLLLLPWMWPELKNWQNQVAMSDGHDKRRFGHEAKYRKSRQVVGRYATKVRTSEVRSNKSTQVVGLRDA